MEIDEISCWHVHGRNGRFGLLNVVGAGGSNFDFKAATEEERLEWMEKQANALKTGARFFCRMAAGRAT